MYISHEASEAFNRQVVDHGTRCTQTHAKDCNRPVTSGGAVAAASTEGMPIGSTMTAVAASSSTMPLTTCVERCAGVNLT